MGGASGKVAQILKGEKDKKLLEETFKTYARPDLSHLVNLTCVVLTPIKTARCQRYQLFTAFLIFLLLLLLLKDELAKLEILVFDRLPQGRGTRAGSYPGRHGGQ